MLFSILQTDTASPPVSHWKRRGWCDQIDMRYESAQCLVATTDEVSVAGISSSDDRRGGDGVVVFEGCLDNRTELRRSVKSLCDSRDMSDATLVGALYRQYEHECVAHLNGDFRVIIYDARHGTFSASVDFASTRRLWWRQCDGRVVCGSGIRDLYEADEDLRLNDDYIVERLATGWSLGTHGPLRGAHRLTAGTSLRVSRAGLRIHKYWCPRMFTSSADESRPEVEYVEEFRQVLSRAVADRVPSKGAVLCDLSGGADSTAVTRLASLHLGDGASQRLHAVTVTYPGAEGSDEGDWARKLARAAGATHHVLAWDQTEPLFRGIPEHARFWDEPSFSVHSYATSNAKEQILNRIGGGIVLGGGGAEAILCERMMWPVYLADSLRRGRIGDVVRGLRPWRVDQRRATPVLWYRSCVAPLLWPTEAALIEERDEADWMTSRALRRARQVVARLSQATASRLDVAGTWMVEQWSACEAVADRGYGSHKYQTRYPFLDRPLVETVLRMPWRVRVRPGGNKHLLRQVNLRLLPEGFDGRPSLPADHAVSRALSAQHARIAELSRHWVLAELGFVEPAVLKAALERAEQGVLGLRLIVTALTVELWIRSVVSGDWARGVSNGELAWRPPRTA